MSRGDKESSNSDVLAEFLKFRYPFTISTLISCLLGSLCGHLCTFNVASPNMFGNNFVDGNLYYFSWAGLATGIVLVLSYIRSVWGLNLIVELQRSAQRLQYWTWLGIVGLIQMGSSARLFDNHCGRGSAALGEMGTVKFCRRCQLGVVLGVCSVVSSTAVAGAIIGGRVPFLFAAEMIISCTMVTSQAVGVALLTSQEGPGAPLNNLFYSSWGSLGLTLVLATYCIEDWSAAKGIVKAGSGGRASVIGEGEGLESEERTISDNPSSVLWPASQSTSDRSSHYLD